MAHMVGVACGYPPWLDLVSIPSHSGHEDIRKSEDDNDNYRLLAFLRSFSSVTH